MKIFQFFLFPIFLLVSNASYSQNIPDSNFNNLDDEELLELFNELGTDSLAKEKVARAYLRRAHKIGDTIKMARGYDRLARIYTPIKNIQYADSVIELTKNIENITYPALGYVIKGLEYFRLDDLINSSENFFKSYNYSKSNNNLQLQVYSSNFLIQFKSIWGDKSEALDLQRERHEIISSKEYLDNLIQSSREEANIDYNSLYLENQLSSIQNFIICYINLKKIDSARYYIDQGFQKVLEFKGNNNTPKYYENWFYEALIETEFYSSNYHQVLVQIDRLISRLNNNLNYSSKINLYLFRGLANLKLNNYGDGIKDLEIADSLVDISNTLITPQQRVLYEELNNYYRKEKSKNKRLLYLNKLLKADSIFKINYQYFEPNFIRNYETPILLSEKEDLIQDLKNKNSTSYILLRVLAILLLVSLVVLSYYFRRQLLYKKRYDQIIEIKQKKNQIEQKEKIKLNKISSDIIKSILDSLDDFESKKKYLSQDVSLNELAKELNTNPRYLSNIINLEKEKNYSNYINDLRVEYAFEKLAEDKRFRRYTIKAIANDCGFNRAESFSKAFYRKYRFYPSFYIKKLNES